MLGHAAECGPSPSRIMTCVGPVNSSGGFGALGALQRLGTKITRIRSLCSCVLQFPEALALSVPKGRIHAVGEDGLRGIGPPSKQPL